jgi:isocitrate lyase
MNGSNGRSHAPAIARPYAQADVDKLRGSVKIDYTLATLGARRLRWLLESREYVTSLGVMTGNQAVQAVRAGLDALYLSGWQVAADSNLGGETYPDQSLYPANSGPRLVERINNALQRADQIAHIEGDESRYWFAPIVADGEAGFGGPLNVFELTKAFIRAGAAAVHFEDQLASEKKCGHMGGKVLLPTRTAIRNLVAARLAADVLDVPTLIIARTDANGAKLITSDIDPLDRRYITRERTEEGFFQITGGLQMAIERGLALAPYADLIWCETSEPNLEEAKRFAEAIHRQFPGKMLAYNCSPSFNWKRKLSDPEIAEFNERIGALGYKFQFVTLAGFHALNHSMFELSREFKDRSMAAYADFQQREFESERHGYTATRHQREVGAGYFDLVTQIVAGGNASTTALAGSTEEEQFTAAAAQH